jgi:hypothetical protein
MRLQTVRSQTKTLIVELEAFLAAIPAPAPDAGAIEDGGLSPLPGSKHRTTVVGTTVRVPGGGNVNPFEPNAFIASGPTRPPVLAPPTTNSGGGSGGAW